MHRKENFYVVDHITALENFILGFRLGARIMLECMESGGMARGYSKSSYNSHSLTF